jgi:hypothetical protein
MEAYNNEGEEEKDEEDGGEKDKEDEEEPADVRWYSSLWCVVRTYTTDLPKGFYVTGSSFQARPTFSSPSTLSPPAIRARSCTIVTWIRPVPHDLGLSTPLPSMCDGRATLHIHISNE